MSPSSDTVARSARAIRELTSADIAAAQRLSLASRWNQTAADWHRLLALAPRGCFGIDVEGELVATTSVLCYGSDLAWIGMVLTRVDHRGHGYARLLLQRAIDFARQRCRCAKLDATDLGAPLYRSLGFEDEQPIERWERSGEDPVAGERGAHVAGDIPFPLDRIAFGADRSKYLNSVRAHGLIVDGTRGYVMHRGGAFAEYMGPVVAEHSAVAEELIRAVIARSAGARWYWDLLVSNAEARRIADSLGFRPVRHLMRMRLGEPILTHDAFTYAIGGFEVG